MSSLKTSLAAALIAVGVTAAGMYFVQYRRAAEAERLRQENGRMRAEASRRWQASAAVAPTASEAAPARAEAATQRVRASTRVEAPAPVTDYRNEGRATPLATLQTFAWACDRGDVETVEQLIYFDSAARTKTEALMATVAETRAQWATPEAMAAALLTARTMRQPFPVAALLERATPEPISDERVVLRLPGTPKDRTEYQKIGDEWNYVITEAMVDDYIRQRERAAGAGGATSP
jgi:hypothetical protein